MVDEPSIIDRFIILMNENPEVKSSVILLTIIAEEIRKLRYGLGELIEAIDRKKKND